MTCPCKGGSVYKKLIVFVVIHEIWNRTESQQKQHAVYTTFIISHGLSHFDLKMFHQAWNGSMLKGINIIQELLIAQQQEDELSCFHPIEVWRAIDLFIRIKEKEEAARESTSILSVWVY